MPSSKFYRALNAWRAKKNGPPPAMPEDQFLSLPATQQTQFLKAGGQVALSSGGGLVGAQQVGNVQAFKSTGVPISPVQSNANVGAPQQGTKGQPSDTRFRSFAERYMIARAHNFRVDHEAEDQWNCILNAKKAYAMIERTGRNIEPDIGDGAF